MNEIMTVSGILFLMVAIFFMLVIIVLSLIVLLLKAPRSRGTMGELQVQTAIRLMLNNDQYHTFHNVTLPTHDGTTQIDHVIVSRYGVFALETKNMGGAIYGTEKDKTWTQKIGKQTHRFQNPLRQNYKHSKTLEKLMNLGDGEVHSVIVFVGKAKLKKEKPENVTQQGECIRFIRKFREEILSAEKVIELCALLEKERLEPTWETHRLHVDGLKERFKAEPQPAAIPQNNTPSEVSCPKCGQSMIIREGKSGAKAGQRFWGYSTFPKCRGTREVKP